MGAVLKVLVLAVAVAVAVAAQAQERVLVKLWSQAPTNHPSVLEGIPLAWPMVIKRVATTETEAGWFTNTTRAGFEAYRQAHKAEYDAWESNKMWQAQSALDTLAAQYDLAIARLEEWTAFLGEPKGSVSNFVNIAQASQWAREMVWLQQRLVKATRQLYRPEEDR